LLRQYEGKMTEKIRGRCAVVTAITRDLQEISTRCILAVLEAGLVLPETESERW